jgi:hypothetical protein
MSNIIVVDMRWGVRDEATGMKNIVIFKLIIVNKI